MKTLVGASKTVLLPKTFNMAVFKLSSCIKEAWNLNVSERVLTYLHKTFVYFAKHSVFTFSGVCRTVIHPISWSIRDVAIADRDCLQYDINFKFVIV